MLNVVVCLSTLAQEVPTLVPVNYCQEPRGGTEESIVSYDLSQRNHYLSPLKTGLL